MGRDRPLSSRERVLLALEHQETDRIPFAMVCSGINEPTRTEFDQFLRREHGCDLATVLDSALDIRTVAPKYIGPQLEPGTDIWGVRRVQTPHPSGGSYAEIEHYPLAAAECVDDVERHIWPQADWFDYESIPEQIDQVNANGGPYAIMALNCNVFETAWYMRGLQQALVDLVAEPELIDLILRKVADFHCERALRTLVAARDRIDLIFTADDIGQQNGLLMSLETWGKHIKPHHVEINRVIHSFGAKVIYHTDGAVMEAVPGLIDMGIDVLQALQFDAGDMDPRILKAKYGKQLCFEGGVSVQKTLPFGTPGQVREEVEQLMAILGQDGGYILGPSHAIQAGTPVENIYTMFQAALTSHGGRSQRTNEEE